MSPRKSLEHRELSAVLPQFELLLTPQGVHSVIRWSWAWVPTQGRFCDSGPSKRICERVSCVSVASRSGFKISPFRFSSCCWNDLGNWSRARRFSRSFGKPIRSLASTTVLTMPSTACVRRWATPPRHHGSSRLYRERATVSLGKSLGMSRRPRLSISRRRTRWQLSLSQFLTISRKNRRLGHDFSSPPSSAVLYWHLRQSHFSAG